MLIYGLSTCPVCQRARKELEAMGKIVSFRDVRADPLTEAEISALVAEFGDRVVDQKSPDYRAMNDWLKHSEVEAQISAKPKVMARPIIEDGGTFYLGWDDTVQSALS